MSEKVLAMNAQGQTGQSTAKPASKPKPKKKPAIKKPATKK
jgi:hypothetical protein